MTNYNNYPYNQNHGQQQYRRVAPQNQPYQQYAPPPAPPQSFDQPAYSSHQYARSHHHPPPPHPSQPQYQYHHAYNAPYQSNDPSHVRGDLNDDYSYSSKIPSQPHAKPQQVPPPTSQPPQNSGRPPPHSADSPYGGYPHPPQRGGQSSLHPPSHHLPPYPTPNYYDDSPNQPQQQVPSRSSTNALVGSSNSPHPPPPPPRTNPAPSRGGLPQDEEYSRRMAGEVFNRFDRDNNGFLDLQEFMDVLRALHLAITYDEAKIKFYTADLDGNECISREEFIRMYLHERREMLRRSGNY